MTPAFTCPRCGKSSWSQNDAIHGYCGACHDYTAPQRATMIPRYRFVRSEGGFAEFEEDQTGPWVSVVDHYKAMPPEAPGENAEMMDLMERLVEAGTRIEDWSKAYPLDVFPEPDLERAALVLKGAGISIDSVSASSMRHVITHVEQILAPVLAEARAKLEANQ